MDKRCNIAILMPYFGKLPPYFGAYLKSLENKLFDVLWISDLPAEKHPENFKVIPMSFDEVKSRMRKTLGINVVVNDGRRLCDFRPMYGQVFSDLIETYDYWGWGDCDLVYGEAFNAFLEEVVYTGIYDVISLHKDFLTGPTCFLRNTTKLKQLYKNANNWEEVCTFEGKGGVYIFDECGGNFHDDLFAGKLTLQDCAKIRDSFSAVLWREPNLKIFREDIINESTLKDGEVVELKDGVLTINKNPIPVFHFVLAKVPRWFHCAFVPYVKIKVLRISRFGFYFGNWAWATRWLRNLYRVLTAALKALKSNGVKHLLKRVFK